MTTPKFGAEFFRNDDEALPILGADFSVIGIVTDSDDANADLLPLNTPKRFNSLDPAFLAGLGTGNLASAVYLINQQIAGLNGSADLVVVRVATGGSGAATRANVVAGLQVMLTAPEELGVTPRLITCPGHTSQFTATGGVTSATPAAKAGGNTGAGTYTAADPAFTDAVKPGVYSLRITGGAKAAAAAQAAGGNVGNGTVGSLTADTGAAVGTWTLRCVAEAADGGSFILIRPNGTVHPGLVVVGSAFNGTDALNLTIADGSTDFDIGDEFTIAVSHSVPSGGGVFSLTDPDGIALAPGTVGVAYDSVLRFTVADGTPDFIVGDGFNITVARSADSVVINPVVAALPAVCESLLAVSCVQLPDTSHHAAQVARETINSQRVFANGLSIKHYVGESVVTRDSAPVSLGLAVRVDNEKSGVPGHPFANRRVNGVVGTNRPVAFSMTDGASEGQRMLADSIGIIVRGQVGVDGAISDAGYTAINVWNTSDDPLWNQIHQIRISDYLTVACLRIARVFLGRSLSRQLVENYIQSIEYFLRDLTAAGHILGGRVVFKGELNSPESIRLGKIVLTLKQEPNPAFVLASHELQRYRPAVEMLIADIVARSGAGN